MRIRVRLYGTLSQDIPDYHHAEGIEVEIPDGATVKDLLARLEISEKQGVKTFCDPQDSSTG
jgi:sulfur carrier protein ThiS